METGTSEAPTSKNGQTDEDYDDAVRALARAYAWIEYVEENTDMDLASKNSKPRKQP